MAPIPKGINVTPSVSDHSKTEDLCYEEVNGKRVVRKSGEAHVSNLYAGDKKDEAKVTATSTGSTTQGIAKQTEAAVDDDDLMRKGESVEKDGDKVLSDENYDSTEKAKVVNIPSDTNAELLAIDTKTDDNSDEIVLLQNSQTSGDVSRLSRDDEGDGRSFLPRPGIADVRYFVLDDLDSSRNGAYLWNATSVDYDFTGSGINGGVADGDTEAAEGGKIFNYLNNNHVSLIPIFEQGQISDAGNLIDSAFKIRSNFLSLEGITSITLGAVDYFFRVFNYDKDFNYIGYDDILYSAEFIPEYASSVHFVKLMVKKSDDSAILSTANLDLKIIGIKKELYSYTEKFSPLQAIFEVGDILDSGIEGVSDTRIRSKFIKSDSIYQIEVGAIYLFRVFNYDKNFTYLGYDSDVYSDSYEVKYNADVRFNRIVVKRADSGDIQPDDILGLNIIGIKADNSLEGLFIPIAPIFEQGSLSNASGGEGVSGTKIRSKLYPTSLANSITVNDGYGFNVYGYNADGTYESLYVSAYVQEYIFPNGILPYWVRVMIKKLDDSDITPDDNYGAVFSIQETVDPMITRHLEDAASLAATTLTAAAGIPLNDFSLYQMADIHGKYQCAKNIGILKEANSTASKIPALILNGGDMQLNDPVSSDYSEYIAYAQEYEIYHIAGQHECGYSNVIAECLTHEEVFTEFFEPMKTAWDLPTLDKNYYYKDIPNKARVICLYQYNLPLEVDPNDATKYVNRRDIIWYGQDQIDWLIATLNSVPSGYAVFIMMHQTDGYLDSDGSEFSSASMGPTDAHIIDGVMIQDIVEAYRTRASINTQYSSSLVGYSCEAVGDFSSAQGVFFNYFFGHWHIDSTGYLRNSTQRGICISSPTSPGDLPYTFNEDSKIYDVINVYGCHISNKEVRVVRIGSDINLYTMAKRELQLIEID